MKQKTSILPIVIGLGLLYFVVKNKNILQPATQQTQPAQGIAVGEINPSGGGGVIGGGGVSGVGGYKTFADDDLGEFGFMFQQLMKGLGAQPTYAEQYPVAPSVVVVNQ